MKPAILTLSSLILLTSTGSTCELKNVSKNIPGTMVSGYCSSNNDQISCSRSLSKRWTCRGVMGVYSNLELGKAIADSCSCQWTSPLKPKDNDNFILKDLSPHELNNNDNNDNNDNDDNDEGGTSRDILDYFTEDS